MHASDLKLKVPKIAEDFMRKLCLGSGTKKQKEQCSLREGPITDLRVRCGVNTRKFECASKHTLTRSTVTSEALHGTRRQLLHIRETLL